MKEYRPRAQYGRLFGTGLRAAKSNNEGVFSSVPTFTLSEAWADNAAVGFRRRFAHEECASPWCKSRSSSRGAFTPPVLVGMSEREQHFVSSLHGHERISLYFRVFVLG